MRHTFESVAAMAKQKGLHVEKVGRTYEVWADCDNSVTAVCASVEEVYQIVFYHEKGKAVN